MTQQLCCLNFLQLIEIRLILSGYNHVYQVIKQSLFLKCLLRQLKAFHSQLKTRKPWTSWNVKEQRRYELPLLQSKPNDCFNVGSTFIP